MFFLFLKFNKEDKKIFFFLLGMSIAYAFPIMISNRLYIDDLTRSLYGNTGWSSDGRPLASLIMKLINVGGPLLNLAPLIQLLSLIILALALTCYAKYNFKEVVKGGPVLFTCSLFGVIGNPFFIENLSYKYDSLSMSMSIAILFFAFCHQQNMKLWKIYFLSIGLIISSLCLYQSSIGIFFILSVINAILEMVNGKCRVKNIISTLTNRVAQFIIAYVLYKLLIVDNLVNSFYAKSHAEMVTFALDSVIIIINNLRSVFDLFYLAFKSYSPVVIFILGCGVLIGVINIIFLVWKNNKSIIFSIFSIFLIFSAFLFTFVHLIILKNPVISPRVFTSVGGIVLLYCIGVMMINTKTSYKFVFVFPYMFMSFVFSYSYSTASYAQEKIDNLISSSIYYDVNKSGIKSTKVSIYGQMPVAEELKLAAKKAPIIGKLVPIYMNGGWWWGAVLLQHYRIPVWIEDINEDDKKIICHNNPISNTNDYAIFNSNGKILILFEKYECKKLWLKGE